MAAGALGGGPAPPQAREQEPGAAACPQGHTLELSLHQDADFDYDCDVCQREIDLGTVVWSCQFCDWDICTECQMRLGGKQEVPTAAALDLRVTTLSGTSCTLAADPYWRVCELKVKISAAVGIPVHQQRLIAGTVELHDIGQLGSVLSRADQVVELTLLRRSDEQTQWLRAVHEDGELLGAAPMCMAESGEVALAAVRQRGLALRHVAPALRGDRDLVMAAVEQDGFALEYATEALRGDRGVVLAALRRAGLALRFAAAELRGDRELVLAAVDQDGGALEHAAGGARGDREVVLRALARTPSALRFAAASLRADRDLVLAAVRVDARCLEFASADLQDKFRRFLPSSLRDRGKASHLSFSKRRA